jgi:hypothetical protein
MKKKESYGFRDWAVFSVNCCSGCSNDCRYCYAKGMAARFGQIPREDWHLERIRAKDVERSYGKFQGQVMFPSSHDITPANLDACLIVLGKLLAAGNQVLVVSKPRLECIKAICQAFQDVRDQILFRFTIGAMDNAILKFWEPGAPSYEERYESLEYAISAGYRTSVSIEPMLDADKIIHLIFYLQYVESHSIWIGKMNHIKRNITIDSPEIAREVRRIEQEQTPERLQEIYDTFSANPMIRWKSCIKRVLGLKITDGPGMDI